jgi:HSP90 family molecular chaperone
MRFSTILKAVVLTTLIFAIVGEEATASRGAPETFDADVSKMLNILINSLYTNRNIFLREIISNASDALDKIRFLYLTNPKTPKNDAGEEPTQDIRIKVDRDKRLLIMQDGGVGMTADDMRNNLGSLGSSGTQRFLDAFKDNADSNLIGQFGVGFYSVFLVADRVKVSSKHDDSDTQWVWESTGAGTFYVYEDERGNTLGRGTELTLELKKDADEFLENDKIKETIHRYSEFIHFPIFLQTTKVERVAKKADIAATEDGEVADEEKKDEEEEFEDVPKTSWELVNENKPIWTRKTDEVTEEEYNKFYKALTKDHDDPMFYTHFSTEGEMEFKALLFIPGRAPYNVFDTSVASNNIRLYVRRVFITDEFKDLLPRYLNFIKGVVDSDDLPLHVSREVLQESRILKIIKKKLVRKALSMLADIAENDKRIEEAQEAKEKGEEAEEEEEEESKPGQKKQTTVLFPKFWEEFGKNLRLGMIEDGTNRARLTKLLRYKSSKSEEKLTSLDDYIKRAPEGQKSIYFLAGESMDKIKQAPVLEDAIARDVEVLYMVDSIDEYVVGHVTDYAGKKLVNLAKSGVKFEELSKKDKAIQKKRVEKYEPLTKWFKEVLGEKVTKVSLTTRRTKEPLVVSSPEHGVSANMARIQKGQTLQEKSLDGGAAKRVLEINHLHPLIDEVFKRVQVDDKDKTAEELALVLFDVASLQNNFEVDDSLALGKRIGRLLRQSVDIAPDAGLVEEDVSEYAAAIEEEEEEAKETEEVAAEEEKPSEDL